MSDARTGKDEAQMVFRSRETRADSDSAKAISDAERKARDEKTARLRAARLKRDAGLD